MILLSFDIEEFDGPLEHGVDYSLEEGMKVSVEGTNIILDILKANDVRATFFCTGNFAENAPDIIQRIMDEGHEVACHGVDHWQPKESDFALSKEIVENVSGITVTGYRQPRMFPVVESEIKRVGYRYNSSLNPAFIPGRYMNLKTPRTWFMKDGVMQIPASVTPHLRFLLRHDGYFVTYFHPWEFYELKKHPEFKMPFIIKNNSGSDMAKRLDNLVKMLKDQGHIFITYNEFVDMKTK